MRKKFILYILFIGFYCSVSGQIGSVVRKNDGFNKTVSNQSTTELSTERLAFSITRNAISDSEKALDIYRWIAGNISYDNELMRSGKLQKEIYTSEDNVVKNVLERKMALCGGYALLFEYLCADVGIAAEAVNGYTKDYSGKLRKRKEPNHTWNAIKLNGKWELLDITWAIGHGIGGKPDDFWYLTKPTDFIYTHYPEDPKWTLIEDPISFAEFQATFDR